MTNPSNRARILVATFLVVGVLLEYACGRKPGPTQVLHEAVMETEADSSLGYLEPDWHPGGEILAVTGVQDCGFGRCPHDIYSIDLADMEVQRMFEPDLRASPHWAPDGQSVSFQMSSDDDSGVFVSAIDTYSPVFLVEGQPSGWSLDGDSMAIYSERFLGMESVKPILEIALFSIGNREKDILYQSPASAGVFLQGVDWSPTGESLAFAVRLFTEDGATEHFLYTLRADGTGLQRHAEVLTDVREPGWMKSGDWLFVVHGEVSQLAFLNVESECVFETEVTGIHAPDLSPDGKAIAFENFGRIYILNLEELLGARLESLECPK